MQMKRLAILLLAAGSIFTSCADPDEAVSGEELQKRLERGVTGQGQLGPINRGEQETTLPPNQADQQHP